jgi:hypothetical protein
MGCVKVDDKHHNDDDHTLNCFEPYGYGLCKSVIVTVILKDDKKKLQTPELLPILSRSAR